MGHRDQPPIAISWIDFDSEDRRGLTIVLSRRWGRGGGNGGQSCSREQKENDPFHDVPPFKILGTTFWPPQLSVHSLRELCSGLFRNHISGVPVGPVRIGRAGAFLVLAVRGLGAAHGVRQI